LGLALIRSSPISNLARTCGYAAIRRCTVGTIGSRACATQKISS
jgi:hypothetical protein